MNCACTATTRKKTKAENNEFCVIGYPHNSSNRCQDNKQAESKICTELGKKQGQVKCSSGLGIGSNLERDAVSKIEDRVRCRKCWIYQRLGLTFCGQGRMLTDITEEVKKQTEQRISSRYIMYVPDIHDSHRREPEVVDVMENRQQRKNSKKKKII